jgi:hypothetical protein
MNWRGSWCLMSFFLGIFNGGGGSAFNASGFGSGLDCFVSGGPRMLLSLRDGPEETGR